MDNIENIHKAFLSCSGVSTDSRNCPDKSMFFALKGEHFDGNKYVIDVMRKGASYAISDDINLNGETNVFIVDNVLETLQNLALFHRRYLGIPILAITGTNGKTTTKELTASVLAQKFKIKATSGNLNNHIGVPITLLSMDESIEFGVVEMGANHVGEINFLCRIAEPDYGLITNVGKAHLEGFGSFEGVMKAKGELYDFLKEKYALAFINADNEYLQTMAQSLDRRFEYGLNLGSVQGAISSNDPFLSVKWQLDYGALHLIRTRLIGGYNLENVLSAVAVGIYFNIPQGKISEAIENYQPKNNRSQFIKSAHNKIIMDAYNANPSSMQVALNNFKEIDAENKIIILGGMKELGADSLQEHQQLLEILLKMQYERVILVGDEFKGLTINSDKIEMYENSKHLIDKLRVTPIKDAYMLIKGSRSNMLEDLLEYL